MKSSILEVDYRSLVSRADLVYLKPVDKPGEGQPIGNGRMGTLVWTKPDSVNFQINRNDVFAVNKHRSGKVFGPTDYCGGCAQITIEIGGNIFTGKPFQQKLSLYRAECAIAGEAIRVRCFVSSVNDLLVMEVEDNRDRPQPLDAAISHWRQPVVKTEEHTARYAFKAHENKVLLIQEFEEREHYCASAVAVSIMDDEAAIGNITEKTYHLRVPAKKGKRLILISTAATWDKQADAGNEAEKLLKNTSAKTYPELYAEHIKWWEEYWSRTFVHLSSADGIADFMERIRTLHLYYTASTSRSKFPPKWNGLLFAVDGDTRRWGTGYVVWTTEMMYFPLYAADAIEFTDSFFNMHVKHIPDSRKAAQQRWGIKEGAYILDTAPFDGPLILPEDVADEYRDVCLGRKPNSKLSDRAVSFGQREWQLFCFIHKTENGKIVEDDGHTMAKGRYSWSTHVVSTGSELAVQAWWRYRYTGDQQWLATHAYPLLRESVEFYRHLVKKSADELYHISGTNAHEDFWGVIDGIMDLAAIRGTIPLALRAAAILKVDAELCDKWKEFLCNLAPYPMGHEAGSKALTGGALSDDTWAAGHLGDVDGSHNSEDVQLNPIFPFEDWTLETKDSAMDKIAQKTMSLAPRHKSILSGVGCNTSIRSPIAAVRAGQGNELPVILAAYYSAFNPLPNGMSLFEGPTEPSIEIPGLITTTLQEGLLQGVSPHPGEPEIISVFPAWPKEWAGSFRLLARGGFLVTASVRNGEVEFVEIESRLGEPCRLRNPWKKTCLVTEIGGAAQELKGDILCFESGRNRSYLVLPKGKSAPEQRRLSPEISTGPVSLSYTLPNGTELHGTLGRI